MHLSEADYAQLLAKRQPVKVARAPKASKSHKPNKFNAVKTNGSDSGKESRRLTELRLLQKAGKIHDLIPQVTFTLLGPQTGESGKRERAIRYTADAIYVDGNRLVVEDTKATPTRTLPAYVMRRKLLLSVYGIEILET